MEKQINIDYKASIFFRIPLEGDEESNQEIIEKVKNGLHPSELYNEYTVGQEIGLCEILYETEEIMDPQDNNFQETVDIVENDVSLWNNKPEETSFVNAIVKVFSLKETCPQGEHEDFDYLYNDCYPDTYQSFLVSLNPEYANIAVSEALIANGAEEGELIILHIDH